MAHTRCLIQDLAKLSSGDWLICVVADRLSVFQHVGKGEILLLELGGVGLVRHDNVAGQLWL